jgi:hypothetical protein
MVEDGMPVGAAANATCVGEIPLAATSIHVPAAINARLTCVPPPLSGPVLRHLIFRWLRWTQLSLDAEDEKPTSPPFSQFCITEY